MKRYGFTILEMLLAVGLSCVLLYGLMYAFLSVTRYVTVMREMTTMQRAVGLTFYQLRTDVSAAFVPEVLYKDETAEEKQKQKAADAQLSKEKKEAQDKAAFKSYFLLSFDDHLDASKIEGTRRYPFKILSFVTTNPLHVFGQKQPRLVRVVYEIIRNKKRSTRDRDVFSLRRKEVTDIANAEAKAGFKDKEREKDTEDAIVQSYVVADNLRGAYLECELLKKDVPRKKDETEKEIPEGEMVQSTTWGDKDPLQGFVPRSVSCWLWFWQGDSQKSILFGEVIEIKSYPSIHVTIEEKKSEKPTEQPVQQLAPQSPPAAEATQLGIALVPGVPS